MFFFVPLVRGTALCENVQDLGKMFVAEEREREKMNNKRKSES